MDADGLDRVDPDERYVVVSLHEGMADVLALFRLPIGLRFAVRDELFDWPGLGRYLSAAGHVRVDSVGSVPAVRRFYRDGGRRHRGEGGEGGGGVSGLHAQQDHVTFAKLEPSCADAGGRSSRGAFRPSEIAAFGASCIGGDEGQPQPPPAGASPPVSVTATILCSYVRPIHASGAGSAATTSSGPKTANHVLIPPPRM